MSAHARTSDRRTDLKPSHHAALRYLQRLDPRERHPKERVRELFERARPADRDDVEGDAFLDEKTDTVLVADLEDRTIVTLWGQPQ